MTARRTSWSRLLPFSPAPRLDRYHLRVVTSEAELSVTEELPIEIRYILAARPSSFDQFRKFLQAGYGIGVRSVERTPQHVLQAVDRISRLTQENTILPWLERLLRSEEIPHFSAGELERVEATGVNLYAEVKVIMAQRFEFKKIILVDLHNQCVGLEEQRFIADINRELYPLAIETIVHRISFDNAHTRTEIAQSILKALIIIGPIAHALEHLFSGLGKLFAASADDLLSEAAELFALHGSGFSWRQLAARAPVLIPVFGLATYGVLQVEPLLRSGHAGLAGAVFGLSAVALSLTTALQSIGMYRRAFQQLLVSGKLRLHKGQTIFKLAWRQDFTNPARLGLFIGALVAPVCAASVFVLVPGATSNGWVLALLGSIEAVVAGCTVVNAPRFERWMFRRKVRLAIKAIVRP